MCVWFTSFALRNAPVVSRCCLLQWCEPSQSRFLMDDFLGPRMAGPIKESSLNMSLGKCSNVHPPRPRPTSDKWRVSGPRRSQPETARSASWTAGRPPALPYEERYLRGPPVETGDSWQPMATLTCTIHCHHSKIGQVHGSSRISPFCRVDL